MPVACGGPSELSTRVPAQSAVEKIAPRKPPNKRRFMVTSGFGKTKSLNHAVAGRGKSSVAEADNSRAGRPQRARSRCNACALHAERGVDILCDRWGKYNYGMD